MLHGKPITLPAAYLFINPYTPWTVITRKCSGIIGVFFKAGSLYPLLKTSMTGVVGKVIEPQAFMGNQPIRILLEKLANAQPRERIALVEKFFTRHLPITSQHLTTVQYAGYLIRQKRGMVSIEAIATQMGISRRAVEKQFAEKVGISPKYYSRTMRFTALQQYLINHRQPCWLDITQQFGYHDQSHLIKDFYSFTGSSPLEYTSLDTFLVERFILPDMQSNSF
jgi:AraC-like DNA-binding protein